MIFMVERASVPAFSILILKLPLAIQAAYTATDQTDIPHDRLNVGGLEDFQGRGLVQRVAQKKGSVFTVTKLKKRAEKEKYCILPSIRWAIDIDRGMGIFYVGWISVRQFTGLD
jgi:hypothetical protein